MVSTRVRGRHSHRIQTLLVIYRLRSIRRELWAGIGSTQPGSPGLPARRTAELAEEPAVSRLDRVDLIGCQVSGQRAVWILAVPLTERLVLHQTVDDGFYLFDSDGNHPLSGIVPYAFKLEANHL